MTKTTTKTARRRARRAEPATRSVVKPEYRARYADGSCGDDLAQRLRGVDAAKLRALAEANGVWMRDYAGLNPGMRRMAVGNRLRALVRRGAKVKWR
jgi:hypothetical protein